MIFTDASALYASLVSDDASHPAAQRAHAALVTRREQLWTIDPVLTELWHLLRRDFTRDFCDRLVSGVLERGLRREQLYDEDYLRAWQIGQEWADQDFSLTDRQAFAAIERSRQFRAWSYDQDFALVRLGTRRDRAIDVVH
jgi:predicted nucleic acid-binding protein